MNRKPLKITGDVRLMGAFVQRLLSYLNKGGGMNFGRAKNHHTVEFTVNNGDEYIAHVYETKTLIVMDWERKEGA